MLIRTTTTVFCGSLLFIVGLLSGCSPKVNYTPKVPSTAKTGDKVATTSPGSQTKTQANADTPLPQIENRKSGPDLIAYDEFDGVHRDGWKQPGLGEWSGIGEERNGAFVVAGDVDVYRELANPVEDRSVWYAITMRMEKPVTGLASVDGSPGPPKRFGKLGFSAIDQPFTSRGFWLETDSDTKIENTELQTFLTRYSFEADNAEGFAERDFGLNMIDRDGMVFLRPRFKMAGTFNADKFSHLSLKKSGPEKLIIERIAIARTAEGALYPQLPAVAQKPGSEPKPNAAENPKPTETGTKSDATPPASTTPEAKPDAKPNPPAAPAEPAAKSEENKNAE